MKALRTLGWLALSLSLLMAWGGTAAAAPGMVWSTFCGGTNAEYDYAVTTDANGDIYVLGSTGSSDYPTTPGAFWRTFISTNDVVVTKLRADGVTLVWSTYLAGSGNEDGKAIAVDAGGNVYVTGNTSSSDFPVTAGAYRTTFGGGISDAFVTKIAPDGSHLIWSTYLGGNWDDYPRALKVDGSGNVYVAGSTNSIDYPVTAGVVKTVRNPSLPDGADGFLTKLNSSGTGVVWSTYVGSDGGTDNIFGLALDSSNRPTVVGWTLSPTYPVTAGAWDVTFDYRREGFVTRLNATASGYVYSTFIGAPGQLLPGSGHDECLAVALDAAGDAFVTGRTESANFPTTLNGAQRTYGGGAYDAFALELNPTGTALVYASFLGGGGTDIGYGVAVTGTGVATYTGSTDSGNFPVTSGAYDLSANGSTDAFVTTVLPTGALGYSTYLGASGAENGQAVALKSNGQAVVAGQTASTTFPTSSGAYDQTAGGMNDDFVTVFDTGTGGSVGVGNEPGPIAVSMLPAQPNPHVDQTTVRFSLATSGHVRLVVRDLQGRLVRALADDDLGAGTYSRTWDGRDQAGSSAPAGMYFLELQNGGSTAAQRIARLR